MKNKKVLFGLLLTITLVITSGVAVQASAEGLPFSLDDLVNMLSGIKTAIENLQIDANVTVENNIPVPDVTVNNEIPVPSVNVEGPTVNVENTVPVPNVTVNNMISDENGCNPSMASERLGEFTGINGDYTFTIPKFPYKEGTFSAKNGAIEFNCKAGSPEFYINGNLVCTKSTSEDDHEICNINPTYFNEGINTMMTNGNCKAFWIAVEYEYTPANC